MKAFLAHYKWSFLLFFVVMVAVGVITHDSSVLLATAILVPLEISLSFDNAVVNARTLARMRPFWQTLFMMVGVLVAVVFVRFLLPIIIVMPSAHMGFTDVVSMAAHNPHQYQIELEKVHPIVGVFAGIYLLQITLTFFFEERKVMWFAPLERRLAAFGKLDDFVTWLSIIGVLVVVALVDDHKFAIAIAGLASVATFIGVSMIANYFEPEEEDDEDDESATKMKVVTNLPLSQRVGGLVAFGLFWYLEVQDAAFSFDGVSGAFAVTSNIIAMAAGLGVGAAFVRSMTGHAVKTGSLSKYRYLEHGAFYAIAILAIMMLVSVFTAVSEFITGPIGIILIGAAFGHSFILNKREDENEEETPQELATDAA